MFIVVCYTGSSKSLSSNTSRKAEEAVKIGRLVVTGQLLEMLSNSKSQRPRSAASVSGIDKTKMGPLSLKCHDISVKDWAASGMSKPKKHLTVNVPKLQTETAILDSTVGKDPLECLGEVKASISLAADTLSSVDPFCPVITSTVSLQDKQ